MTGYPLNCILCRNEWTWLTVVSHGSSGLHLSRTLRISWVRTVRLVLVGIADLAGMTAFDDMSLE